MLHAPPLSAVGGAGSSRPLVLPAAVQRCRSPGCSVCRGPAGAVPSRVYGESPPVTNSVVLVYPNPLTQPASSERNQELCARESKC